MSKYTINSLIVAALLAVLSLGNAHAQEGMLVEKASPLGFDATIEKLISNAKGLGWKVPKKWKKDFQKNLMKVTKKDIGKAVAIEMCEPHAAAELLQHDEFKMFLSMMPCTVSVYEKSDGKVYLSMMNIQLMGQTYKGQKAIDDLVNKLGPQMEQMLIME